jgi:catechol 2,3-dioxygenase-like lactoylglutathione lyase family enzyme
MKANAAIYLIIFLMLASVVPLPALGQSSIGADPNGLQSLRLINVALSVGNLEESVAWYRDKLGFALVSTIDNKTSGFRMAVMEKNGLKLDLILFPASAKSRGSYLEPPGHLAEQGIRNLVFRVDDLRATNAELKARGVKLIWESRPIPEVGTFITNFWDNSGNLIAIWGDQ